MEGREAMAFPGAHTPFYFPRGAFTSISPSQSASAPHAPPPGFRPLLSNPNLQHPFPFSEQRHHQEMSHGIHMGMSSSSPIVQPPQLQQLPPPSSPLTTEPGVKKKKRGRPRKYVADNEVALGLSPMPYKAKNSSSISDPNAPKRARGRPPGTGRKQRLANLGEWMNNSAGLAFAPHVISVEVGEDIVSKIFSFAQQRPRALCIMSGTGKVSSGTLHLPTASKKSMCIQGNYDILSLGGSYLVNEEGAPKSRTGNLSVSLSRPDGFMIAGGAGSLIAASLVQVVACSFVYGSAKAKIIKQENGSKENNNMETPTSEPQPASATEAAAESAQAPLDFSASGWAGSGGGNDSTDSRNHNHLTDINLTCG